MQQCPRSDLSARLSSISTVVTIITAAGLSLAASRSLALLGRRVVHSVITAASLGVCYTLAASLA